MSVVRDIPESMIASPFSEEHRVASGDYADVQMSSFPATDFGHLLFVPQDTNAQTPFQMNEDELKECFELMDHAPKVIETSLPQTHQPEGYTIGWNIGAAGGQTVAHAHAHIFGRKEGDSIGKEMRGGIAQVLLPQDDFYHGNGQPLEAIPTDVTLMENDLAKAVPSPHPVAENHVLILPKRDVEDYRDLSVDERAQMVTLAKEWLVNEHGLNVEDAGAEKGANIGWNIGAASGQTYTSSAALEVIPRTLGDVEHARGGLAKIVAATGATADYYRGDTKGDPSKEGDAPTSSHQMKYLLDQMRSVWPKEQEHSR